MDLRPGLTKDHVQSVLGPPARRELYEKRDKTRVEYLMYRNFSRYHEETPICFINNKVVGWGPGYYQDHVDSDDLRLK